MLKYCFSEPESAVVHVARDERTGADRDDKEILVCAGDCRNDWRHDTRRRDTGDGGRSDRQAQEGGDDPAEHQRREAQAAHRLRNRGIHASRVEHATEAAAGPHHQQHARDGRNRVIREAQQTLAVKPHDVPNV